MHLPMGRTTHIYRRGREGVVTMFANPLPPTWIQLHIILYKSKGSRSTSEVSISADVPNFSLKWCWFGK